MQLMHVKRWITALLSLPVIIYLIGYSPPYGFYILTGVVQFISLRELYRITKVSLFFQVLAYLLSFFLLLLILEKLFFLFPFAVFCCICLPFILSIIKGLIPSRSLIEDIAKCIFGIVYITVPFLMLVLIYCYPGGKAWIFFLLCVIFTTDTFAFYFGRYLGRHKLNEKLSPKKTWEGAISGFVFSVICGLLFIRAFRLMKVNAEAFILVSVLSIMGQIGDLAESMIKRSYNVKDSGSILPGHGGMLDRIDSFLFSIPILYGYILTR